ncbi:HoxN/HupN/NixA family nickel/cobalt transporter [Mycobacterium xenopi]|nr:HoxN/HupN/NixA family nickel/cobalt transporter [Mycobacterium xenopi]MDA3641612.1 HoxN/HupN/NixA family nickel/cobalt transporter [Mycobacterium xenopi]MDA3663878.1 HoxN/HupN/NixA family nickel/cobalt transporter [Mycobacterium xenopi]ORX13425.1 nickel transporter [Mycobacterium xenopi]
MCSMGNPSFSPRFRWALTPHEWLRLGAMLAVIFALHVIGWSILILIVKPAHFVVGNNAFGIGIGLAAYTLGVRHAFDADHIAAIDNTTRKLINDGQRPLGVGFFFSFGHSSVVFGLSALIVGFNTIIEPVKEGSSALHRYTSLIGATVSGTFLYLIALINVVILIGILRTFTRMRRGVYDKVELEQQLNDRGLLNRILGRFTKSITASWHMYPVGLLFGLGFDTATEVALLVLAGTSAGAHLPWYAILCLPVLFTAGMCLFDTIDGSFMNFAYAWAFSSPVRKVYYNITITGLSVAVALLIGSIELLALLADQFGWSGPFWNWIDGINLNAVGFVIVGLFVLTWVVALAIWRSARIEERWTVAESVG